MPVPPDAAGPIDKDQDPNLPFWARITDTDTVLYYAWTEVDPEGGAFADSDGGSEGTLDQNPAYEENQNPDVAVGTVVRLRRAYYDEALDWVYVFAVGGGAGAPAGTGDAAVVRVSNTTPDADGLYDGFMETFDDTVLPADPWDDATPIKIVPMNGW